jgi:hypothetical protein
MRRHHETVLAERDEKIKGLYAQDARLREAYTKVQQESALAKGEQQRVWVENSKLKAALEANRQMEMGRATINDARKQGVLKTRKSDKPATPPTAQEQIAIAALRGIWAEWGRAPADSLGYLGDLLDNALHDAGWPWLKYFRATKKEFENGTKTFQEALAPDAAAPLREIERLYVQWIQAWHGLVFEIARIYKYTRGIISDRHREQADSWRALHAQFYVRMAETCRGWPDLQKLDLRYDRRFFWMTDDSTTGDFVWPLTPTPTVEATSAIPDTEAPPSKADGS